MLNHRFDAFSNGLLQKNPTQGLFPIVEGVPRRDGVLVLALEVRVSALSRRPNRSSTETGRGDSVRSWTARGVR